MALAVSSAVAPGSSDRLAGPNGVTRFWPVAVIALMLAAPSLATAEAPRQILILYSHRHDLPMNQLLDPKLRATFGAGLGDRVEVDSEYIDEASFPDRDSYKKLLEYLHHKHSPRGLDLIVVVASVALDLVQDNRDWFFPGTPVVFLFVTDAEVRTRRPARGSPVFP